MCRFVSITLGHRDIGPDDVKRRAAGRRDRTADPAATRGVAATARRVMPADRRALARRVKRRPSALPRREQREHWPVAGPIRSPPRGPFRTRSEAPSPCPEKMRTVERLDAPARNRNRLGEPGHVVQRPGRRLVKPIASTPTGARSDVWADGKTASFTPARITKIAGPPILLAAPGSTDGRGIWRG